MIKEAYYYVPDHFRTARLKTGFADIVSMKTFHGNYIGDSEIKRRCGFHVKDTGAGQEDLIAREVTNIVKEYPNTFYEGIRLIDKQCEDVRLEHPMGFNFYISMSDFHNFIFNQKIDIVNGILQSKFRFAIWNPSSTISLINDTETKKIITYQDVIQKRSAMASIKANQLEVGKIYKFYQSIDPYETIFKRILFLGKLGNNSKYLLMGDGSRSYDIQYVQSYDYYVFVVLDHFNNCGWCYPSVDYSILQNTIGGSNFIFFKTISKRIRCLDDDQNAVICYKDGDRQVTQVIDVPLLFQQCKEKINSYSEKDKNTNG